MFNLSNSERRRFHSASFMLGFLIVTILGFVFFRHWQLMLVSLIVWLIANLSVGIGNHRLLTHRGFKVPKWIEYTLTIFGCLALQGGPIYWVAVHRLHHQFTDKPGDPHSPRDGKLWAQWLWMLMPNPNVDDIPDIKERYAPDLMKDKVHLLIHQYWWVPSLILGATFFLSGLLGGLFVYSVTLQESLYWAFGMIIWGSVVHVCIGWQFTWMVNSVTHFWGYRRFETDDDSTNCWWVAVFTFGEGWHNNHHNFPRSVRHGLAWYEFDVNYYIILMLNKCDLAWDLQVATLEPVPSLS